MSPRAKISFLFWIVILGLLPFFLFPLVEPDNWPNGPVIGWTSFAAMLLMLIWRWWADLRQANRETKAAFEKFGELKRSILSQGEALAIRGGSGIWLLLVVTFFDSWAIWIALHTPKAALIAGILIFTPLIAFAALFVIPAIGKPVLILSKEGVHPVGFGFIPWSAVEGIELEELRSRGSKIGYIFRFFVPDLSERMQEAHPFMRLAKALYRGQSTRSIVSLKLRRPSELPQLIERLSRELWKVATGRDYPWSIHFPAEHYQLLREASRIVPRSGDAPSVEDAERQLESLRDVEKRLGPAIALTRSHAVQTRFTSEIVAVIVILIGMGQLIEIFTNFVASNTWTWASLLLSAACAFVGFRLVMARSGVWSLPKPHWRQRLGFIFGLVVAALIVVSLTWGIVEDLGGDPIARRYGTAEVIVVTARKVDSNRRRGCDLRLRSSSIGDSICLTQEEFQRLPPEVAVELHVRRTWIGYHVDSSRLQYSER